MFEFVSKAKDSFVLQFVRFVASKLKSVKHYRLIKTCAAFGLLNASNIHSPLILGIFLAFSMESRAPAEKPKSMNCLADRRRPSYVVLGSVVRPTVVMSKSSTWLIGCGGCEGGSVIIYIIMGKKS